MPANAPDPVTPLWRAAQVFRLLSCLYALGFQIAVNDDLDRPAIGWLLFAVLIAWSAACAFAYLEGFGRRLDLGAGRTRRRGGVDAVHRVRRVRAVGAEQPVLADHAVGDQRDDIRGHPARPDLRNAQRRGDRRGQHPGEGCAELRPRPQRDGGHRTGRRTRRRHGRTDRAPRARRPRAGRAADGEDRGAGTAVPAGTRRRHSGACARFPPWSRDRR